MSLQTPDWLQALELNSNDVLLLLMDRGISMHDAIAYMTYKGMEKNMGKLREDRQEKFDALRARTRLDMQGIATSGYVRSKTY